MNDANELEIEYKKKLRDLQSTINSINQTISDIDVNDEEKTEILSHINNANTKINNLVRDIQSEEE
tara:strand:- start:4081 stop:4278 length:198 start_codon:yes stop_codon:yes gene_type:complete